MLQWTLTHGAEAAVQQVAGQYDVGADRVRIDLGHLLRELEQRRLVRGPWSGKRSPGKDSCLPYQVLAPLLSSIRFLFQALRAEAWAILALAYLCCRILGWPKTVTVWRQFYGNARGNASGGGWAGRVAAVDEAVRKAASSHVLPVGCKERSLCNWALLRANGWPATLVVGINLFPLSAHCWCESGPWILGDERERCEDFAPVVRYE
jgi:hypothetical protein